MRDLLVVAQTQSNPIVRIRWIVYIKENSKQKNKNYNSCCIRAKQIYISIYNFMPQLLTKESCVSEQNKNVLGFVYVSHLKLDGCVYYFVSAHRVLAENKERIPAFELDGCFPVM